LLRSTPPIQNTTGSRARRAPTLGALVRWAPGTGERSGPAARVDGSFARKRTDAAPAKQMSRAMGPNDQGAQVAADNGDPVPPLLGHVEIPSSHEITRHNGHVCRFRGWVASTRGRPTTVRVHGAHRTSRQFPASRDRPDVLTALRENWEIQDGPVGFDFYLDLPPRHWGTPPEIIVELTDGEFSIPERPYRVGPNTEHVLETYENDSASKRRLATQWLHGRGLEFGALHQPLRVDDHKATVEYADRLTKAEALETFPDITEHFADAIVDPKFIVDLNTGDLNSLKNEEFDFFIASDVIEHVANPMEFLKAIHDVMKPGARLLLSVPDRRFTHDADRPLTSNRHLWREYQRGVTRVDNRHLRNYLKGSDHLKIPWRRSIRERLYEMHRERSVHVHVWDNQSFDRFLDFSRDRIPLQLTTLDAAPSHEATGAMVYVLERQAPG
jgi:SAM-dependent methyltransferase